MDGRGDGDGDGENGKEKKYVGNKKKKYRVCDGH